MDSAAPFVVGIDQVSVLEEPLTGGKVATIGRLKQAGLRVAGGFCITTSAYRRFLSQNALESVIALELGRKPLEGMRWEELWDAALRIRSAFLKASFPDDLSTAITIAHDAFGREKTLVVRSSAPGEDSALASFAGIHESVLDVSGRDALFRSVRTVWASLWSDAALLYRRELSLDPLASSMAVLVQEFVESDVSGVAFSRNPVDTTAQTAIVEAVPGRCSDLVDGLVDPDRWILNRTDGETLTRNTGNKDREPHRGRLLQDGDLKTIWRTLLHTESLIGTAIDLEWTGRDTGFTVLQARPISTFIEDENETRSWYLSLRPASKRLKALSQRVTGILIPELEAVGRDFASERLTGMGDAALADALSKRWEAVKHWRKVYREEFIPFAHGVRQLGLYYNDRVCPEDPYEFVGLLKGENLLALERNRRLSELAMCLRENPELIDAIKTAADPVLGDNGYQAAVEQASALPGGVSFVAGLEELLREAMDVTYGAQRMAAHPGHLLRHLYALSRVDAEHRKPARELESRSSAELEARLFSAVGPKDRAGAEEILEIGRLSWRLRDDDNILLARLEAQLLDTLGMAVQSLSESGRVENNGNTVSEQDISIVVSALRDPQRRPIALSEPKEPTRERGKGPQSEKPRQLLGQPAAPGVATGLVRIVDGMDDLRHFQAGDVLVCRAIEPTMTHLVPLARAIIELRGGMLIHGAIIARELGIPCVNGIAEIVTLLNNGDLVTVDGYLGIVTVGAPEFDLEKVTPEARPT